MCTQNIPIDIVGLFFKIGINIYQEQKYLKIFISKFKNTTDFTNNQVASRFNDELKTLFSPTNAKKLKKIIKKTSEYDVRQTLSEFFEHELILINQNSDFEYMLNEHITAYTDIVMNEIKKHLPEKFERILLGSMDKAISEGFIDVNAKLDKIWESSEKGEKKLDEIKESIQSIKSNNTGNQNSNSSSHSSSSSTSENKVDVNINLNSNDYGETIPYDKIYLYQDTQNENTKLWVKILLWLVFPYIMVFVAIFKSKKLSLKAKLIISGPVLLFFILIYTFSDSDTNTSKTTNTEKSFYRIGEEAVNSDFEILFSDYFIDYDYDDNVLVIELEIKYIGNSSYGIHPSYDIDYKLNDSDGLVYEEAIFYSSEKLPYTMETGDKGITQIAFEINHEVENDLIFRIFSDSYTAECDFKCNFPKDDIISAINEFNVANNSSTP